LVAVILLLGRIHQAQLFIILWLIASFVIELFPAWKFRSLLLVDFSAYFIAGATFFLVRSQGITLTRATVIILAWLLALFEATSNELPVINSHYKSAISSVVVGEIITGFFCVMLLISLRQPNGEPRINRWALLGSLTYPLYLLHQKIGYIFFNALYPRINAHVLFWSMIIFALSAAFLVHFFIEKRYSTVLKKSLTTLLGNTPRHETTLHN
jgi:hypothetical protein